MPRTIRKKIWPKYFQKILTGEKTYDVRLGDFAVDPGDEIIFAEFDPAAEKFTGREVRRRVGWCPVWRPEDLAWPADEIAAHGIRTISLIEPDRGPTGGA